MEQNRSTNLIRKRRLNLGHKVKWIFKVSLHCTEYCGALCDGFFSFFLLQNCLALQSMWMVYGIEQNSSLLHSLSLFRFWFSLLTMVLT